MKLLNVLTLIVCVVGGIFNVGCTTQQRKELMAEMQDYVQENVIPVVTEKAKEFASKEIEKYRLKQYDVLNESLSALAPTDEVTGQKLAKTWRDFDLDKNSDLESKELFTLNSYVWREGQKRVNEGKVSKEEFDDAKKKTGIASAAILAALAGAYLLKKKGDKDKVSPKPPAPPVVPV